MGQKEDIEKIISEECAEVDFVKEDGLILDYSYTWAELSYLRDAISRILDLVGE